MRARAALLGLAGLCLAAPLPVALAQEPTAALTLDEVLDSVERYFPLLEAAREDQQRAEGDLLAARGGFDLELLSKGATEQLGFYRNRLLDFALRQPTQVLGATLYTGYSIGRGNFPAWRGDLETLSDGEWRVGLEVPLLRDRDIDPERALLRQALAGIDVAAADVAKQRLTFFKEAAKSYWNWVASGRQLVIARQLLDLAELRTDQLEQAIELGDIAAIERVDNQRAILQRRSGVLMADQTLAQSGVDLGLFHRRADGTPAVPDPTLLPVGFPEPETLDEVRLASDLATAITLRPEVDALLAKRRQTEIALQLADNTVGPSFDLKAEYSRDFGEGSITKVGNELKAGFSFKLPLQQRKGQGKALAEAAKLRQIDARLRFLRDRIEADVRNAAIAVQTAAERVNIVRQEVEVALQLEEAERERFELGDSTLFLVNLRELATASARLSEVKSLADYHKALAEYRAATGQLLQRATPTP